MKRAVATLVIGAALALSACREPTFTEPQTLGGVEVPAEVLEHGREAYLENCVFCHGASGDGRGPAATGLWPAPRDFTAAHFKFAGIQDRGLPDDAELARIVRGGLNGTSMKAWDIPDQELFPILQYIKTFSPEGEGFRDDKLKVKKPEIPPDPYAGKAPPKEVLAEGERLYHAYFECAKCHPSYVAPERFADWDASQRVGAPYDPVPKWSENYGAVLLPPDFLRHPLRSVRAGAHGHRADDLYRVIAYGLEGPMPGYGYLGADKVWAVAYYVKSLADLRGTEEGRAMRAKMRRYGRR